LVARARSDCGSTEVPLIRWPGAVAAVSVTVRAALPAVETTVGQLLSHALLLIQRVAPKIWNRADNS
jgi:hypothetical protein